MSDACAYIIKNITNETHKLRVILIKNEVKIGLRYSYKINTIQEFSNGSNVDPLRFLAECRTRRLNQALSVLSFSLGFLSVSVVLLTRALFAMCYFMLFVCSVYWL